MTAKSPIYVMLALWLGWLDSLTCETSVMNSTVNFMATQSEAHVSETGIEPERLELS